MILTSEQKEIVNCDVPFLAIKAFAGTGKTTTLVEFAKKRPDKKFVYLAFNASVVGHAKGIFPRNVEVVTAHSLAYRYIGRRYSHKLKPKIRVQDIRDFLSLKNNREGNLIGKIILELLTNYFYSCYKNVRDAFDYSTVYPLPPECLINYAEIIWEAMKDQENEFPITHDVYLKLYQLYGPKINKDYILFDEAQDANPAIVDIVYKQMDFGISVVFVGDEHQAIYGFRGAKNTLRKVRPDKVLYLTESFRFGSEIANVVNSILKITKKEEKSIIGYREFDSFGEIDSTNQFAIITRTNANLFLKACDLAEKEKKIYFVGGYKSYQFYKIKDVEYLYNEKFNMIRDEHIKSFKGFSEMMDTSEEVDDKELIYLGKIVDRYKGKVSDVLKRIKAITVESMSDADVVLSTAHKSKGLEFDQVMLTNDFVRFIDNSNRLLPFKMKEEEVNILYVAASRAKIRLRKNSTLNKIVKYYEENKNHIEKKEKSIEYKKLKSKSMTLNKKIKSKIFNNGDENDG